VKLPKYFDFFIFDEFLIQAWKSENGIYPLKIEVHKIYSFTTNQIRLHIMNTQWFK